MVRIGYLWRSLFSGKIDIRSRYSNFPEQVLPTAGTDFIFEHLSFSLFWFSFKQLAYSKRKRSSRHRYLASISNLRNFEALSRASGGWEFAHWFQNLFQEIQLNVGIHAHYLVPAQHSVTMKVRAIFIEIQWLMAKKYSAKHSVRQTLNLLIPVYWVKIAKGNLGKSCISNKKPHL